MVNMAARLFGAASKRRLSFCFFEKKSVTPGLDCRKEMLLKNRIILFSMILCLIAWLIVAVFDYAIFYKGNFFDLLNLKSPGHDISIRFGIFVVVGIIALAIYELREAKSKNKRLANELQNALADNKRLSGILPICCSCKKIRDDQGYWNKIEYYIEEHSEAEFTHGICPDCANKLYPE